MGSETGEGDSKRGGWVGEGVNDGFGLEGKMER